MAKIDTLNRLIDSHEERVIGVLKKLEDDIIIELQKSIGKNLNLNTQIAIQLRPSLKALIEKNFLSEATLLVSEYDDIVIEYQNIIKKVPIPTKFKNLTKADLDQINNLKFLSFSGFETIANTFLDDIANEIYQSSIVGKPFAEVVKSVRGKINGVYQRSNEDAINRLVGVIDKNKYSIDPTSIAKVQNAREILQSKYSADILGNNMRKYASQIVHDSIMQFDGQFTKYKANEAGITSFKYTGTNITTTREFCRRILKNPIYTEEEARSLWQSTSWRGKSGSDPFVNRGGYNCRHSFIPYDEAWEQILKGE